MAESWLFPYFPNHKSTMTGESGRFFEWFHQQIPGMLLARTASSRSLPGSMPVSLPAMSWESKVCAVWVARRFRGRRCTWRPRPFLANELELCLSAVPVSRARSSSTAFVVVHGAIDLLWSAWNCAQFVQLRFGWPLSWRLMYIHVQQGRKTVCLELSWKCTVEDDGNWSF